MISIAGLEIVFLPYLAPWQQWAFGLVLLLSFILTLNFVLTRLSNKTVTRKVSVALLNMVAFVSIALLASDIQRTRTGIDSATLLTQGSDLEKLIVAHPTSNDDSPTFVLQRALLSHNAQNDTALPEHWQIIHQPEHIVAAMKQLQKLMIKGDGLSAAQLRDIQALATSKFQHPLSIEFEPSTPRLGLINMQWKKQLVIGQQQKITGRLQLPNDPKRIVELSLLDPAGDVVGTQRLKANDSFGFDFVAQMTGQWVYTLALFDANTNKTLNTELVAFDVAQYSVPSIAIFQSAPSFETRHLTNWAAQFGTQITVATQISQARFITQYFNQSADAEAINQPPGSMQENYANGFQDDIIIMDGRAWLNLANDQRQALRSAVEQGAGFLLIADRQWLNAQQNNIGTDSSFSDTRQSNWFNIELIGAQDISSQPTSIMTWQGLQSVEPIPFLPAKIVPPSTNTDTHRLVQNEQGLSMVVSQRLGQGRVAVSLISNSYQWQLSGKETRYSQYWQYLLAHMAKPAQPPYWVAQGAEISLVNQAQRLCAISGKNLTKETKFQSYYLNPSQQSVPLLLSADLFDEGKTCVHFWPLENAWYDLVITNGKRTDTMRLYSYDNQHWLAWQQHQHHQSTQQEANKERALSPRSKLTPVSKVPIWVLFLIVAGLVWAERKFLA